MINEERICYSCKKRVPLTQYIISYAEDPKEQFCKYCDEHYVRNGIFTP